MAQYSNNDIAELLRNIAACYELQNKFGNKFKIVAYERAADAIEHLTSEIKDIWDDNKLEEIAGIGPSIAEHLDELFRTGRSKHFEDLTRSIPSSVFTLMKIPGIGPKTALKLVNLFKISSKDPIKELEEIALNHKIRDIEGFGEDSESAILQSIKEYKAKPPKRLLISYAQGIADEVIDWMKKEKSVKRIDPLGSLRRKVPTIGDIDIAVASDDPQKTIDHFSKFPNANRVFEKGDMTAGIIVGGNVHIDLMVQPPQAYGATLQHFTGSKHHNVALREYALKRGLSLSEKGIKNTQSSESKIHTYRTEEDFYGALGMEWIPPELREDIGEIELAVKKNLPSLIEPNDVKGDLQIHSSFDIETSHDLGQSSMEEIVKKANALGYEYIAFTEHNPSKSKHTPDQIVNILKRKREAINKLNDILVKSVKNNVKKVFNSLEIDIMPDGSLSVPDVGMQTLDFALVSIHSVFRMQKADMTKRVLSALSHPKVKIFAHPTARKLNDREGVELNWPEIFDYCLKNDKWLECNADPARLDLPDILIRDAVKAGVRLTLGTDAHNVDGLDNMKYGVWNARRGWAEKKNIMNCLTLTEFESKISN